MADSLTLPRLSFAMRAWFLFVIYSHDTACSIIFSGVSNIRLRQRTLSPFLGGRRMTYSQQQDNLV